MKSLRNASSLILVAPKINTAVEGISVLSLKRSTNTSHFPSAYVFPGGNSDVADYAPEWLSVLPCEILNVPLNIESVKQTVSATVNRRHEVEDAVSSRITAIRETFEECGILLCKLKNEKLSSRVTHLELDDASEWRERVRKNAHEFVNLCRHYRCFPDIGNLYFLSTWITPVHYKRRYSCNFFVGVMDHQVEGKADECEIESAEWYSSSFLLENAYLPPPQIYELSMLTKFPNIDLLCEFALSINSFECSPLIPVHVNTEDGLIIILPGDEKYEELDYSRSQIVVDTKCTAKEYRGNVMHRIEIIGGKGTLIIRNFSSRNQDFIDSLLSKKSKM